MGTEEKLYIIRDCYTEHWGLVWTKPGYFIMCEETIYRYQHGLKYSTGFLFSYFKTQYVYPIFLLWPKETYSPIKKKKKSMVKGFTLHLESAA